MKKTYLLVVLLLTLFSTSKASAQDPILGEIKMFAGNFAPVGWYKCDGQLLSIAQNSALFSILGTTYGGNGTTTFALPDFRGRVPMNWGNGPGLSPISLGEVSGQENTTLSVNNLPSHSHTVALPASTNAGTSSSPTGNILADTSALDKEYTNVSNANTTMAASATSSVGNNASFSNMQPYLAVTFIICYQGIYPSHP